MPLLQCSVTGPIEDADKRAFAAEVTDAYAETMATDTGHVAVTVAGRRPAGMAIGREVDGPLLFLRADIREGRGFDRKREFALAAMAAADEHFGVPDPNAKVVFDEHPGEHMMGVDRVGGDWSPEEGR